MLKIILIILDLISISIYCTFICELRKENFYFFSSDFWEFLFFYFLCGLAFFTLQKIMALGVLASVNGIPIFAILSILATQLLSFLIAFKKRVLSCVSILGAKKTGTTSITFSIMVRSFQHFFAHNAAFICLLADANRLYGSLMYFFFHHCLPIQCKTADEPLSAETFLFGDNWHLYASFSTAFSHVCTAAFLCQNGHRLSPASETNDGNFYATESLFK